MNVLYVFGKSVFIVKKNFTWTNGKMEYKEAKKYLLKYRGMKNEKKF